MLYVWSILAKKCSLRLKIEVFSGSGLVPTVFHFPTILHFPTVLQSQVAYFSRVKTASSRFPSGGQSEHAGPPVRRHVQIGTGSDAIPGPQSVLDQASPFLRLPICSSVLFLLSYFVQYFSFLSTFLYLGCWLHSYRLLRPFYGCKAPTRGLSSRALRTRLTGSWGAEVPPRSG